MEYVFYSIAILLGAILGMFLILLIFVMVYNSFVRAHNRRMRNE